MELKPGYKQTEAGVIPEDWNVLPAGDFCKVNQGLQIAISNRLKTASPDSKKYITIQYLNEGKETEYIEDYSQNVCCNQDDVLMTRTGNTGIVITNIEGVFHNNFFKINYDKKIITKEYLVNFLQLDQTQRQILIKAGTSTIPDLNHNDFYSIYIVIPPIVEQQAIATALSEVDALIESLDRLIAKKRDIKQAAMQELLTGKRRLPGFSGEWGVKRIGDVLTIAHGKNQHAVESPNGIYPILGTGGEIGKANTFLYDKPSVLIGRKGTIDKPQFMDTPFWTVDTLFYSIIFEPNNAKFLYYRFCLIDWKQYNEASGVPSLNARTIERIELKIPLYEEQKAIATILSDIDAEITALEKKRDKTKLIKQGMMQELLTGKIRLVEYEAKA